MNIFDGKLLMIVDLNRLLQKLYLFLKKKAELTALVSKKAQVWLSIVYNIFYMFKYIIIYFRVHWQHKM